MVVVQELFAKDYPLLAKALKDIGSLLVMVPSKVIADNRYSWSAFTKAPDQEIIKDIAPVLPDKDVTLQDFMSFLNENYFPTNIAGQPVIASALLKPTRNDRVLSTFMQVLTKKVMAAFDVNVANAFIEPYFSKEKLLADLVAKGLVKVLLVQNDLSDKTLFPQELVAYVDYGLSLSVGDLISTIETLNGIQEDIDMGENQDIVTKELKDLWNPLFVSQVKHDYNLVHTYLTDKPAILTDIRTLLGNSLYEVKLVYTYLTYLNTLIDMNHYPSLGIEGTWR